MPVPHPLPQNRVCVLCDTWNVLQNKALCIIYENTHHIIILKGGTILLKGEGWNLNETLALRQKPIQEICLSSDFDTLYCLQSECKIRGIGCTGKCVTHVWLSECYVILQCTLCRMQAPYRPSRVDTYSAEVTILTEQWVSGNLGNNSQD